MRFRVNRDSQLSRWEVEAEHIRSSILTMQKEIASQKARLAFLESRIQALKIDSKDVLGAIQGEAKQTTPLSAADRLEMAKKLLRAHGKTWYCDSRKGGWSLKPEADLVRHKNIRSLLVSLSHGKESIQVFKRPGHHCCLNASVKDKKTKELLPATIRYWFKEE